jgi:hypothetical protein
MTSCDAVVGCGASGIAWADMDIRPRPSANADAARIFIGYFLSSRFSPRRGRFGLRKQHGSPVTPSDITIGATGAALPVVTVPMAMPVAVPPTPMPMPVVPMPVPVVSVPVAVVVPTDLLRLEMIDFFLCGDCGLYTFVARWRELLLRQSW